MSFAIATTTTATVGAISGIDLESWIATVVGPDPPPHWSSERRTQLANWLEQLDPELGRLARSVWQSFYGGADNAERASLLSMRQLYDHLFSLLAPDDKVRNSPFFTTKGGDKPSQVDRKERLHYAAVTHVRDAPLRETLLSQVDHVIQVYDRLNELHARKPLERRRAQNLIMAMEEVLHEWLSATSAG